MRLVNVLLPLALSFLASSAAMAEVKVGALFADNAVLQRQKPINVWGTAEPGEIVVVRLAEKNVKVATADKDGNWGVSLAPMEAGGPFELNIRGSNRIIAHKIYVGEVWLCSGQSNMVLPTSFARDSKTDIANSANPDLHLFKVEERLSATPITEYTGSWQTAQPDIVRDFSGIAYYFGRQVQEKLKIPVGIVCSAYAGTPIKIWMSEDAIQASHDTSQVNLPANFIAVREVFDRKVAQWQMDVADARAKGLEEPAKPVLPPDFYMVSSAFYAMINPIIPYSVRGVVWYQGESDTDYPFRWHKMFACMCDDWRQRWHDETLPFLYVQLPGFGPVSQGPGESLWAELREGQLAARRIPYTYMTCTIDTVHGKFIDMHPHQKKEIGKRLGNVALAAVYKEPVPYCGPLYESMEIVGTKIRLNFRFADGGLVAKNGPLHGFEIAGPDKKFYSAQAQISGDSILCWSEKVPMPVAVRYGWASNPDLNLFNKDDLPASPFRTDKWVHHWGKGQKSV